MKYFILLYDMLAFVGDTFKAFFIKRAMGSCGKNVLIKPTSSVFKGLENFTSQMMCALQEMLSSIPPTQNYF